VPKGPDRIELREPYKKSKKTDIVGKKNSMKTTNVITYNKRSIKECHFKIELVELAQNENEAVIIVQINTGLIKLKNEPSSNLLLIKSKNPDTNNNKIKQENIKEIK
jgi:hypothetical protein